MALATPFEDIPVDILPLTVETPVFQYIENTTTKVINLSLRNGCFSNDLKSAEIRIQSKYRKMRTRKTSAFAYFLRSELHGK